MRSPPEPREPLDTRLALRLYRELGSYTAVAREMGYHPSTVARNLKELGVRPRRRGRRADERSIRYAWKSMLRACEEPSDERYPLYGARGIGVCRAWRDIEVFRAWALRHYARGKVLVLVDPEKDFSPRNCRWVERREMLRRRETAPMRILSAFGESMGITDWARDSRCRVCIETLRARLAEGWLPEDAIRLPPYSEPPRRRRAPKSPLRKNRDTDWTEVERLVLEEGMTRAAAARRLRIPEATVYAHFRNAGIRFPSGRSSSEAERRLAVVWRGMHFRARRAGASVAPAWRRFDAFRQWARENGYRRGKVLVRIDPNRGWSPANCRVVPRRALVRFHKEGRKPGGTGPRWTVEAFGEEKGPTAWSRDPRCAVALNTLVRRLREGWSPEDAITASPMSHGHGPRWRCLRAFGESKTLSEWARDPRCVISHHALRARLARGVPLETALTTGPWELRG